jgi:hypothetical protein
MPATRVRSGQAIAIQSHLQTHNNCGDMQANGGEVKHKDGKMKNES